MTRPCICGHRADDHLMVTPFAMPSSDGQMPLASYRGPCAHTSYNGRLRCSCVGYEPDRLSRVSELLGLDVRLVVA